MAAFPGRPGGVNPMDRNPLNESWKYDVPTITSSTDGMYDYVRPMNTRKRKMFTVAYDILPDADIELIKEHFEDNGLSGSFNWIDRAGTTYTVRYMEPISVSFAFEGFQSIEPIQFKEI